MGTISRNGSHIGYEFDRIPGRPVLLFSNSLGTHRSMWKPQVEQFGEQFSVLRYDTRGHGESSVTPGPYTMEQLGGDVLSLLDALHVDRVHFCGISMGGLIGQWLALHAPRRIDRLILSNTAAHIGTEENWNARIATVKGDGMRAVLPGVLERWFRPEFRAAHSDKIDEVAAMLLATDPLGYTANCAAVRDADFRRQLSAIVSPTLVIFGRSDPVTTEADADFIASRIPNARLFAVDGAHLSNLDPSAEWNAAVLAFLTEGASHG